MVRTHTSTFRGGYYSHGKQFIEHLPVPPSTPAQRAEIEDLVVQVIDASDAAGQAKTPHQRTLHERHAQVLNDTIESCVSALFGLSADDMAIVRAVPVPA